MSNENEKLSKFDSKLFDKQLKLLQKRRSKEEGCKVSLDKIMADLAGRLNVSGETVKHWKKGDNKPGDYDKVISLAEAMEVDPEEFEANDNEKDTVISMTENNTAKTINTDTDSAEQFKAMSSGMNDMLDLMKKYQEVCVINKGTVSSVYSEISDFLETYRLLDYKSESDILTDKFNSIYKNVRKLRLEIPRIIYNNLIAFITEYLYMITGIDKVLSVYLTELNSRDDYDDISEYVQEITDNPDVSRVEMSDEILEEYFKIKTLMAADRADTIKYINPLDEIYCKLFLSNREKDEDDNSLSGYYDYAIDFIMDLYQWIYEIYFYSGLVIDEFEVIISNPELFKYTLIQNAYNRLDSILSAYIP